MTAKPWGVIDPNSQHQLWSEWVFTIRSVRRVAYAEVKANAARWLTQGFGSTGQVKVEEKIVTVRPPKGQPYLETAVVITCQVEGPPAHDPEYVASVRRGLRRFVDQGWSPLADCDLTVRIMAGNEQCGRPAQQLVVMPRVAVE